MEAPLVENEVATIQMDPDAPVGPQPEVEVIDVDVSEEEAAEVSHSDSDSAPTRSGFQREVRERDVQTFRFARAEEVEQRVRSAREPDGGRLASGTLNRRVRSQVEGRAYDVLRGACRDHHDTVHAAGGTNSRLKRLRVVGRTVSFGTEVFHVESTGWKLVPACRIAVVDGPEAGPDQSQHGRERAFNEGSAVQNGAHDAPRRCSCQSFR